MTISGSEFHLFPHTLLSETAVRHLGIMLPRLCLQQILRPPEFPGWIEGRFAAFKVIEDARLTEKIALFLKGFNELAQLSGESGLLGPMSRGPAEESEESRIEIQGEIRGRRIHDPDAKRLLLVEAGVFMEMSRELDEKEMELELGYDRASKMEGEFREILGISGEEELGEAAEIVSPPLSREKTYLLYMISRRIAFWSRLFLNACPESDQILVALSPEVVEEVLDPIRTRCEKAGKAFHVERIPLVSIPSLERLPIETLQGLYAGLKESGILKSCWDSLERLVQDPSSQTVRNELNKYGKMLGENIEARCRKSGLSPALRVEMTLVRPDFGNENDFWESLDKDGRIFWEGKRFKPPRGFLCLGEV